MATVLIMNPIYTKEAAFPSDPPLDLWLPYEQRLSERYVCKGSGQEYERFQEISTLYEDEDYPEGDLISENEVLPEGLVAWNSSSGNLRIGTIIRVMGNGGRILFEEEIIGEKRLGQLSYYVAKMNAPLLADAYAELYNAVRFAGSFRQDLRKFGVPDWAVNVLVRYVDIRGTSFSITFSPMRAEKEELVYTQTADGLVEARIPAWGRFTKVEISLGLKHVAEFMLVGTRAEAVRKLQAALGDSLLPM